MYNSFLYTFKKMLRLLSWTGAVSQISLYSVIMKNFYSLIFISFVLITIWLVKHILQLHINEQQLCQVSNSIHSMEEKLKCVTVIQSFATKTKDQTIWMYKVDNGGCGMCVDGGRRVNESMQNFQRLLFHLHHSVLTPKLLRVSDYNRKMTTLR